MPNIQMGKNLPKVTEYVKNLGKSVAYSTVDYFKGSMEDTSEFIESNQELFKDIYSAARNYRDTMKAVDKSIRTSKVYEAGQALKKSLFESIRTGKFYDEKREQEYSEKAAGDMADFGDMDDWGSANDFDINVSDESFDQSDAGKSSSIVSGAIHDATEAQAGIIAKSTEYLAETHKASTKLLFAQGERLYATVNGGLANTQALLSRVNGFLEGPLTTHMENSTKFYQEITGKMNEVTAMMKESLEMQRNLYKKEQKSYEGSQYYKVGSNPDLKEYSQQVFKNFKEFLGPEVGMLLGNDMGEGSNMLMALVANPLRFIPDYLVRIMVPATIKKSLETLDKSFSGLFANMIARFNKWGSDTSDAPEILKAIGRIFGLRTDSKSTIDTSNYEKGAVPFDGVTKKAITQVIPGYLARIESALTTREERLFDYESGKWMNVSEVEKRYKSRKQRTISDAAYDTSDEIREYYAQLLKKSKAEAEKFQKNVQQVYKKIYEDYGAFEPYRAHGFGDEKQDPWDYYAGTTSMSKEEFLDIARMIVGTAGAIDPATGKRIKGTRKRNAMGLAAAMLDARESQARWYRDIEARGLSPIIQLAAGAYKNIDMNSDELARTATGGRANLSGINNMIVDATDKYNKNIFYYLRGMYAELMAIRQSGLGGGKGRGRKRGGPTGPVTDPRTALEKALATEVDAEAARVAAQNISDQQSENGFNADNFAENWRLEAERRLKEKQDQDKKKGLFGRIMSDDEEEASDKGFLESLLQAGSLGAKFKVITQNINKLMAKPGLAIAGIIDTADRRLFQLVFGSKEGEEITDKEGRSVKGFLEYMVMRTRETFDNLNDWLDENILEPLKKKLGVNSLGEFFKKLGDRFGITDKWNSFRDKYVRPVGQRLKEKFGWGWGQFKGAMSRTYGAALHRVLPPNAKVQAQQNPSDFLGMGPIDDGVDYDSLIEYMNPDLAASGGLVTRRGLAIISPGERIVPIGGRVTQRNNLAAEKAFAKRFGIRGANYFAGGNATAQPIPDLDRDKVVDTTKTVINEVMGDTKHKGIANVIASGLIGGGVSLITGLVGGPLLGAAVGSAFGIAQNSQTVQEWLFGKEIVNQDTGEKERSGGVISKDFQEKFKKYFPGIRDFGIAGAVAGLFTPFGLVGGLVAGSALGFAKQTDTFQEWLFGKADENGERDGGLLKKEFRDKVKKAAPRMAIGAVGGALLGPFGILGNAVLGSALGYVTTTDQFKNFVFGKPDENGKRKGGLVGAMYDGLLKPALTTGKKFIEDFSEFVKNKIFNPLERFIKPFGQLIKNTIIGIGDFVKDKLADMAEKTIGQPLKDFLEHKIFRGVLTWTRRLLFLPAMAAKGLIQAPFALAGAIGNNIRMGQIRRGTATDMTAAQRNEFRKQHPMRRLTIGRQDLFSKLDREIAGLTGEEGISRLKDMRSQIEIYTDTKRVVSQQAANKVKEAGEILSDYLRDTAYRDDTTKNLYQVNKFSLVKSIHKAIAAGDINKVSRLIYKLNIDKIPGGQADQLIEKLAPLVNEIKTLRSRQKNVRKYQSDLQSKLSFATGGALHNTRNIRRFGRMLSTEIDAKEAELAEAKAKNPEQAAANTINDTIDKNSRNIINILKQINFGIRVATGQAKWGDPDDPNIVKNLNAARNAATKAGIDFDPEQLTDQMIAREHIKQLVAAGTISEEDAMEMYAELGIPSDTDVLYQTGETTITSRAKKPGIFSRLFGRLNRGRTVLSAGRQRAKQITGNLIGRGVNKVKDKLASMKKSYDTGKGEVESLGGLITGSKRSIMAKLKNAWHVETTADGQTAAVDSDGKVITGTGDTSAIRKDRKEKEEKEQLQQGLLERLSGGVGRLVGGVIGTVGKLASKAKEGIFGFVEGIANNTGIIGKIFKGLGTLGLLAVGVAAAGHFSELWKTTIWPNFVQPALSTIGNVLGGLFSKVGNFLAETFPKYFGEDGFFTEIFNGIKTAVSDFIEDPGKFFKKMFSAFGDWLTDGWSLFNENIFQPLWNNVIEPGVRNLLPYLSQAIYDAMHADSRDGLLASVYGKDTRTVEQQAVGSSGKKIWIDSKTGEYYEADEARSSSDKAYTIQQTSSTTNYNNKGGLNQIRNNMFAQGAHTDYKKEAHDNMYNRDYMLLISSEKSSKGQVVIQCTSTKEFIQLKNGDKSTSLVYGYACDARGEAVAKGAAVGLGIGFGILVAVTIFASVATGGLFLVGLGTVVATAMASAAIGGAVGGTIYQMQGGGYYGVMEFPIDSSEAQQLLRAFGVNGTIDNWPQFPQSTEYLNMSGSEQTKWKEEHAKSNSTVVSEILDASNTAKFGTSAYPANGTAIYIWDSYLGKTKGEKWQGTNAQKTRWVWLRAYFEFDGNKAYYDTRISNFKTLPPEIQEAVDEDTWVANDDSSKTNSYPPAGTDLDDPLNFNSGGSMSTSSSAGRNGSGRGTPSGKPKSSNSASGSSRNSYGAVKHLYQNSADLANKRFGNSTIGDAGCAPVAAVNMLNRMSGMGPGTALDSAINMATGYQDSTGGTTMDYFTDYFNANGYGASQTDSKNYILNSLAAGNPAVLLGNSGKETGTPFGANNHYINALGFDKTGKNIVVEDPDLPQSTVRYPAKDVLKDTISGVVTGGRRAGFARKLANYLKLKKLTGKTRSGKANTIRVYSMVFRAIAILYGNESGGDPSAINPNDNGAVSIGLIQWRGPRARRLLVNIINLMGDAEAIKILGQNLYDKIVNKTDSDWNSVYFTKGSTEYNALKTLLATEESKQAQQAQMVYDTNGYITTAMNMGVVDEDAIMYCCHLCNAYGYLKQKFVDAAASIAGSKAKITLDAIYQACLNDSYYYGLYGGEGGYAQRVYNSILNTEKVGNSQEDVDIGNLDLDLASNASTVSVASSYNSTATDESSSDSLVSIITKYGKQLLTDIYGQDIMNLLGAGSTSSSSSSSSTSVSSTYTPSGVNVQLSPNATTSEKQKALSDVMKTISIPPYTEKGKILYSRTAAQNPDKGTASCASTVAWAYNKVLGFWPGGDGYASSTSQHRDKRFTDIYVNNGGGPVDTSILQPGDIMYYNWNTTSYNPNLSKPVTHTEMYAGDGYDWNHGGDPAYGPVLKSLGDYRKSHLMKVRRYNDFMSGQRRKRKLFMSGHARSDTPTTISKANTAIRKYGIDSNLVTSPPTDESSVYAQYFAAMVTLLSVIADNTEALSSLQTALAQRGATVPTETIQAAAGNARKRMSGKSRNKNIQPNTRMNGGYVDLGDSTDMQNILNSPTGDILRVMEALATE